MYSKRGIPVAISHRGLRKSAPENSIPAFLDAIENGAQGIELDVHATSDGAVVVHHDAFIESGDELTRIDTLTSAEIGQHVLSNGTYIPTLDDTIDAIRGRALLFIEMKALQIEHAVARCLRRHPDSLETFAIHSFDHRTVKRMVELIPSVRAGILQTSYLLDSCGAMRRAGATDLWQQADFIDGALVSDVHAVGGRVIAWTANSSEQWSKLSCLQVDGICTDRVDLYSSWKADQDGEHRPQ